MGGRRKRREQPTIRGRLDGACGGSHCSTATADPAHEECEISEVQVGAGGEGEKENEDRHGSKLVRQRA